MLKIEQIDKEQFNLNKLYESDRDSYYYIVNTSQGYGCSQLAVMNLDLVMRRLDPKYDCALIKITRE